jgi:hypothetical protein
VGAKQIFYAKSRLLFVYVVVSKKACVAAALSRLLLFFFPSPATTLSLGWLACLSLAPFLIHVELYIIHMKP